MKSLARLICLGVLLQVVIPESYSQTKLWNTHALGGNTESGVVYEIRLDGTGYNAFYDFIRINGEMPRGQLLYADDGMFYGLARGGYGNFGSVIYKFDPVTDEFFYVHDFFDPVTISGINASEGNLVQHSNGKVYGVAQYGGQYYDGILYELDLSSENVVYKVEFEKVSKGETPIGHLEEATNGKLYGVCHEGGAQDFGNLFVYDPANNIFSVLKEFDSLTMGANPINSPIQASNGKLYGMTMVGGLNGLGTVYEYDIITNAISILHDFDGVNSGAKPQGRFYQASNGLLYGMTSMGGSQDQGTIIEFDINTGIVTKKYDFYDSNGKYPSGDFIEYSDGYLYALTSGGGIQNRGVLFRYDPIGNSVHKLQDMYDEYGEVPYTTLTEGPGGKLFGVAYWGGVYSTSGVLFDFHPPTGIYTTRLNFRYGPQGARPFASLMNASDGMVYGIASDAGELFAGTIFRINPDDMSFEKLYDFDYFNTGGGSSNGMMQASNGLLYGLTSYGGSSNDGAVFAFDPATVSYTVLYNFDELTTGKTPEGLLVETADGKLYGVTERGGVNGDGVLFEYDMNSSTFSKLIEFQESTTGKNPTGLVQAANGKLYGLAHRGGTNSLGVLFEYDPLALSYEVKIHFDGNNRGSYPMGILLEYEDNQLYGVCNSGGTFSQGALFKYNTISGDFVKVINFDENTNGSYPFSTLMKASDEMIYGTTYAGGQHSFGTMFRFDPDMGNLTTLYDYSTYGNQPQESAFIEVESDFGLAENIGKDIDIHVFPNPVNDQFSLSCDGIKGEITLMIIDICGKTIMHENHVHQAKGMFRINMDVSDLPKGVYTLMLISEKAFGIQKILVQ